MLVLSRKQNQTLRIGDDIELKVLEVRGGVVRLGINAPNSIPVLRGELAVVPVDDSVPATDLAVPNRRGLKNRRAISACPR